MRDFKFEFVYIVNAYFNIYKLRNLMDFNADIKIYQLRNLMASDIPKIGYIFEKLR
jgi:hypothetical protein